MTTEVMTTEVWKVIKEFPKYEISTFGNVRNIETKKILKQKNNPNGYKSISLVLNDKTSITKSIHRLVALTFIPNPENKPTVNHKDHNPLNNNVSNLEWFTQLEQVKHRRTNNKEKGARAIWRIDKNTGEKLELYQTVSLAAKWVLDNGLSNTKKINCYDTIVTKICAVAQNKTQSAYTYKWEYDIKDKVIEDEIWKPIPKEIVDGIDGYSVSSLGRIKNRSGRITTGNKHSGYLRISIYPRAYLLHTIVAKVFLPNPENKPIINHIDGNKENARLDNLEWVTSSENSIHAIKTGLTNHKSVIQYDLNMNKLNEFSHQKEASDKLNISRSRISLCCNEKINSVKGFIFKYKETEN